MQEFRAIALCDSNTNNQAICALRSSKAIAQLTMAESEAIVASALQQDSADKVRALACQQLT